MNWPRAWPNPSRARTHPSPLPVAERKKIEKVVENRIKSVKTDLEKQIATLSVERNALTGWVHVDSDRPGGADCGDEKLPPAHGDSRYHGPGAGLSCAPQA
jgi:hypothetical protein